MVDIPRPGALLFAKDLDGLARFYERLLGLSVQRADGDHVVLASATFELIVHAIPAAIAQDITIGNPPEIREETPIKLLFPVASIADARAIAASLGGQLNPPDREWQAHGIRVCDGYDPEGNVFQLRQAAS